MAQALFDRDMCVLCQRACGSDRSRLLHHGLDASQNVGYRRVPAVDDTEMNVLSEAGDHRRRGVVSIKLLKGLGFKKPVALTSQIRAVLLVVEDGLMVREG